MQKKRFSLNNKKQQQFLALYEPVHARFERFCRAKADKQMEYRDLMNDTLLIAFQKFETVNSEKAFLSFLIGISIRLMANHYRKKREVAYTNEETMHDIPGESRTDVQAEIHLLNQAIDKLPEGQKECIILYEITGFSIKEIAVMHRVSESAVKKRLERGRKKLLQLLMCSPFLTIAQYNNLTKSNAYLNGVFGKTRKEPPSISFEEIKFGLSNTLTPGYSVTTSSLFSQFNVFMISLSCFSLLTIIAIFSINNYKPISDEISEATFIPASIDFRNTDTQKKTEVTFSQENDQETLVSSTTHQSLIQNIKELERDSSKLILMATLVRDSELIAALPLKMDSASINQLMDLTVEKQPIILPEQKEKKKTAIEFTINNQTSTQELASIAYQAQKAGIEYNYVVDLKKQLIREFNVDMTIPGTNLASTVQVSVPKKEAFEIKFGWFLNAEGKAIQLTDNVFIEKEVSKHPLRQTLARKFCKIYMDEGINYIEQHFDQLIKEANLKGPKEHLLNTAGYLFLKQNAFDEAVEIFNLNTRLFPNKANLWDSLGEGLYTTGDKENALKAFQKALSIKPKLYSSRRWVKKIMAEQ